MTVPLSLLVVPLPLGFYKALAEVKYIPTFFFSFKMSDVEIELIRAKLVIPENPQVPGTCKVLGQIRVMNTEC